MENRYSEEDCRALAARLSHAGPELDRDLAVRVYTSRLLGADKGLVLHGGGNTSVKTKTRDLFGEEREVIYVKASGTDLDGIEPSGFAALDLSGLKRLRNLDNLSPEEMANQLRVNKFRADDPDPSLDTLVHVFLPHRFVDHTHADAILVLTNRPDAEAVILEALGPKAAVCPYATPGFPLAKRIMETLDRQPDAEAIVVLGHGLFTFGDGAETSYGNMIEYVHRAETFIQGKLPQGFPGEPKFRVTDRDAGRLVQALRGACSYLLEDGRRRRFIVDLCADAKTAALAGHDLAGEVCGKGVLTPDHVIRTKNHWVYLDRVPENDEALKEYVAEKVHDYNESYDRYFRENAGLADAEARKLDSMPRVFVVPGLGVAALGFTRRDARIAGDIAGQTLKAKLEANLIGPYQPLPDARIFELEYWGLEQKKLGPSVMKPLEGQTALISGGGGAIGLGIAMRLIEEGAVVAIADIDLERLEQVSGILTDAYGPGCVEPLRMDVTDLADVTAGIEKASLLLGGIDLLVPNAGVAHVAKIEDLEPDDLERVLAVNLKGTFNMIKAAAPVFRRQGSGGNVVLVSSKNVFDPGASFSAYSSSKAGAHQIGKIAAMELAELGVKVNMINPDAVFGCENVSSKLWDLVGPDRMRSRGLDPDCIADFYQARNLLKARVTAEHVGNAVVFFASDQTPTTGATLPVDGGVQGAFPR